MQTITALIIAYNARQTIERALQSAFSQIDKVVLVDDGSTDGTAEYAESIASGYLKVIKNTRNLGTAGARHVAIHNCETEFAIWLDADDMFLPGRVKHCMGYLKSGADYVFDSAELYDGTRDEYVKELAVPEFLFNESGLAYQIERNYIPSLGCAAVRTAAAKNIGYDVRLSGAEDYDHFLRALLSGKEMQFSSEVNYRQYAYEGSVSRDISKMNESVSDLLLNLDDQQVFSYLQGSGLPPYETQWIWCNYLIRQQRYEETLQASNDFSSMILGNELEALKSAPLPYTFGWKATFCRAIALLALGQLKDAEKAFSFLNEITETPEGLNNLGVARAMQKKNGNEYFAKALAMKNNFLDAAQNLKGAKSSITYTPLRVHASRDKYE